MNRRELLKYMAYLQGIFMSGCSLFNDRPCCDKGPTSSLTHGHAPLPLKNLIPNHNLNSELAMKSRDFKTHFTDDILISSAQTQLLYSCVIKLRKLQKFVGYGNFNVLTWDRMIYFSRHYHQLEPFSRAEIQFLDDLFHSNAEKYGFMGEKVFTEISSQLKRKNIYKVPNSGHFLLKEISLKRYEQIIKDVGPALILTSGVRGVVKQFHLFLEKTLETKGNLSMASRSLAPPGYSFHGRGDFDVGKINFGIKNFTEDFASTNEYKLLSQLGYVGIRYPKGNILGVRFEPWHVKV